MTRRGLAAAIVLLVIGTNADAYRIDEYLQATMLAIGVDRIDASMRLVPGAAIASSIIATIDADADGAFSGPEQRAYADRLLDDLSITIDGRAVRPTLVAWRSLRRRSCATASARSASTTRSRCLACRATGGSC